MNNSSPLSDNTGLQGREAVAAAYQGLRENWLKAPDKAFIGGGELQGLDQNLVVLSEDANEHPRSWKTSKKVQTTAIVAGFCFLAPFASTIFAPSVHLVMHDLNILDSTLGALQVSIFLFSFALCPLVLAPLSELYGRSIILHSGNLVFIAFSIGGGFARTPAQLAICRLFAGMGGSSGISVVGGVVMDLWDLQARPKASGMIMLGPILGPILGPVCGGWMSAGASWRWTMWLPAIIGGALGFAALLSLHESYGPTLLQQKLHKERVRRPGDDLYSVLDLVSQPAGTAYLFTQFVRPVVYLFLDPALFFVSFVYSVYFGITYLVLVTFADIFGFGYGHSVGIVGTEFLALGIGMIVGTFGTIKGMEKIFAKDREREEKKFQPESRLLSAAPGIFLTIGGLFMFGFSALKTHFMVPLVGISLFACGITNVMSAIQVYAVEGFQFPASAFAAVSFLRCVFAGAFPLFGAKLFVALGVDWGVGLLGFIALGFGVPFIPVGYIYGARLRSTGRANMAKFEGAAVSGEK